MIESIRRSLPELPNAKRDRFVQEFKLSDYDATVLTSTRELADYYESALKQAKPSDPKLCANWVTGTLSAALNKADLDITESPVDAAKFAGLLSRIGDNTISGNIAKKVFEALWHGEGDSADTIIEAQGLKQVTDAGAIEAIVDEVIAKCPDQVADYRGGKEQIIGFLVGQVMQASKGKANPAQVNEVLRKKLTS